MISAELLSKIKKIEFKTNYLANEVFSGEYVSAFRGQGMEFEEVREYQPGDEIRTIDWKVTARMDRPFVKVHREEREMTLMILVDASSSLGFGTRKQLKRETAAELASLLAYAAVKSHDKVGLILFTDRVEKYIPAKKGKSHIFRIIQEILDFKPQFRHTNLSIPLEYLMRVMHRRCISIMISDFYGNHFEKALSIAKRKHDLVAIQLVDPSEKQFPDVGYVQLEDPESGTTSWVKTNSKSFQKSLPGSPKKLF